MSKIECYNCHRKGHFGRECRSGRNQGRRSYGDNGRSNEPTNESSSHALVAQDGLGGYDWRNDFEVEPVNYALMAISSSISSSSSNSEVQKCSKQCLESFKCLQKNYDTKREKQNKAKLEIRGYEIALELLKSRILGHAKNELAWGNFLTPRADISFAGLDEYAIRNKIIESQTSKLNTKTSETSGQTNDANTVKPKSASESVKSNPKINRDRVIIEDWTSDDEEEVSEVQTVRPETQTVKTRDDKSGQNSKKQGIGFRKVKACFVCKSTDHLIKDCNFHDKKSQEPKLKNVVNTGQREGKPVWDNTKRGNLEILLQDHAVVDSGCSSHMTGNKAYLSDYEDFNGGFVAFGSDPKGGKITGKGKIKTANLDFDDVYFVDELKFNLFSVSQMCDKKNSVLFTDTECLILSPSFKLLDESQVVLRAPRKDDVYSLDLKNIVPSGGLTCLYANATTDESKLWHRRLGHVNFKNMNKLVKGNLVRGLPSKVFVNDHTCVACKKGKQHKASCKAKLERTIRKPLELLHMDLFGPVSVHSINKKRYCLVVTDDFSRFSWVFFLGTKDETSEILFTFITGLENQLNHKVKIIRCDHGTEFKNYDMNVFCAKKGIKREYSVANVDPFSTSLIPNLRELHSCCKPPSISFMRPFGCPLTILNTLDPLGKFDGKSDEGYLLGYSTTSKAFRVYNKRTKRVDKRECEGEYVTHDFLCTQENNVAGSSGKEREPSQEYILLPIHPHRPKILDSEDVVEKEEQHKLREAKQALQDELEMMVTQDLAAKALWMKPSVSIDRPFVSTDRSNIPYASTASTPTDANVGESSFVYLGGKIPIDASTLPNADLPIDPNMPDLEDASDTLLNDGIFNGAYDDEDVGVVADFNNMDNTIDVSPIPTLRIHKDRPKEEPKNISQALKDESWVEAMQEELLQFKLQQVWILVDLPFGKKAIGTKCVFRNKRGKRSIVVKNKARLIAQGHRQEERKRAMMSFYGLLSKLYEAWYETLSLLPVEHGLEEFMRIEFEACYAQMIREMSYMGELTSFWDYRFPDVFDASRHKDIMFAVFACASPCSFFAVVYHSRTKHIEDSTSCISDWFKIEIDDVLRFTLTQCCRPLTKGFDVTRTDMDLRMDRCSAGKFYSYMVWDFVPLLPAMLAGAAMDQGEGTTQPPEPHPTHVDPIPSTSQPPIPSLPHPSSLHHSPHQSPPHSPHQSPPHSPFQSPPYSPPHSSPPRSYEAPLPEGNTSGSAEASIQLKELMVLVPSLVTRVTSLEKELKDTKQTLGNVVLKLVKKVKSLEKALKRKSKKVIVSASEGEEPEDQGRIIQDIDDDPLVSLVRESMKEKSTDFVTPTKASGEAQEEEEISPTILEAAKTLSKVASQSVSKAKSTDKGKRYRRRARSMAKKINTELDAEDEINTGRVEINSGIEDVNTGSSKVDTGRTSISTSSIIHSPKKGQREGKAQMVEEDIQATHKTKEQIRQEEAGLEEAIRLQAQMDEEVAKQIHLDKMLAKRVQEEQELSEQQLKRKAEVQKAAQFYTEEDWDTIRAKLEANTEVVKSLQGESISNDDFAKRMVEMINEKKKFYAEQKAKAKRKLKTEFEKLMKIDIEDASITKEKEKVVKEEETEVPVKKTGMRRKQKARKGINIDKTAQDEFNKEREAYVKDKVKDASSESEIGVDVNPTATKPPTIVNWKIISQLSQKAAYQIIRKDGSDKIYMSFQAMLKYFSKDELVELYRLVIKKYGANTPE
ncbi:putative ribonuclease H-like domain-containing protein [Tanacetum coccineum]